jgi:two-component system, NarL family, nitrate/nitrite response regulator NarL
MGDAMTVTAITVLVVDDHVLLTETLEASFSAALDFRIETASTVESALMRIAAHGPFDAVLLDYDLPDSKGLDGLRQIISANCAGVALFSGVATWPVIESAMKLGASGFLPKTLSLKKLENALRMIANGGAFLPFDVIRTISSNHISADGLKPRERRVLTFLSDGLPNKQIARELGLSEITVKMDVRSICRKLGARNRTEAALEARKLNLA